MTACSCVPSGHPPPMIAAAQKQMERATKRAARSGGAADTRRGVRSLRRGCMEDAVLGVLAGARRRPDAAEPPMGLLFK